MSNKSIASPLAPKAIGPYSQAIKCSSSKETLYVSGQLPIDANTGEFAEGGIDAQIHQVFKNLDYILNEAGFSFKDVVKTTVYLADMRDFSLLNEIYAQYYSEPYPARVAYQVAALPKGAKIEIDVIASK
jgi:endoribonuclease L-PSP, putative